MMSNDRAASRDRLIREIVAAQTSVEESLKAIGEVLMETGWPSPLVTDEGGSITPRPQNAVVGGKGVQMVRQRRVKAALLMFAEATKLAASEPNTLSAATTGRYELRNCTNCWSLNS